MCSSDLGGVVDVGRVGVVGVVVGASVVVGISDAGVVVTVVVASVDVGGGVVVFGHAHPSCLSCISPVSRLGQLIPAAPTRDISQNNYLVSRACVIYKGKIRKNSTNH